MNQVDLDHKLFYEVSNKYGAPMGRRDWIPSDGTDRLVERTFYLRQIEFLDGDYDKGGAYWGGGGDPVYAAYSEAFEVTFPDLAEPHEVEEARMYIRAANRNAVKEAIIEVFPNAQFSLEDEAAERVNEFYRGYVEAMLWSTNGGPDYSEAPDGYTINSHVTVPSYKTIYDWEDDNGDESGNYYATKQAAIIGAWDNEIERCENHPPDLESLEGYELSEDAQKESMEDCEAFVESNLDDLLEYAERRSYDPSQGSVWAYAGHDFWLTRAGHGAGYWDRGLGELGDRLTEAAKVYGNVDPYIGDDDLVHL